jgi:hypothetical protein
VDSLKDADDRCFCIWRSYTSTIPDPHDDFDPESSAVNCLDRLNMDIEMASSIRMSLHSANNSDNEDKQAHSTIEPVIITSDSSIATWKLVLLYIR